jgi:hypothetical protein
MTSDPNKVDADIQSLLNLLNASEESDAANDVSSEIIDEPEPPEAQHHLTNLMKMASVADQLSADPVEASIPDGFENKLRLNSNDNESLDEDTENRFAAHIVLGMSKLIHGMSKLKRE